VNNDRPEENEETQGPATEPEPEPATEPEPSVEDLLGELPLSDKNKKVVAALLGGLATNLTQINKRLETLETRGDSTGPELFEGLTAEQKYNVLLARASAPAQAAQTQMWQGLLGQVSKGSGGGGNEIDQLLKSGERINALRSVFSQEPSPVQVAMEKAQVASVLAQTRLMNRVAGKQTDDYLDKLEQENAAGGSE